MVNLKLMVLVRERFMLLIRKPQKAFGSVTLRMPNIQFYHCHNVNAQCGLAERKGNVVVTLKELLLVLARSSSSEVVSVDP